MSHPPPAPKPNAPAEPSDNGGGDTPPVLVGCDVGGTFTDAVAWDGRRLRVLKLPTAPDAFHGAVVDAVKRLARRVPSRLVHGSTVATNALLQRSGASLALVTNAGFEGRPGDRPPGPARAVRAPRHQA